MKKRIFPDASLVFFYETLKEAGAQIHADCCPLLSPQRNPLLLWDGESHSGETQRSVVKSQRIQVGPGMACLFLTGASKKCIQNEAGDWLTVKATDWQTI